MVISLPSMGLGRDVLMVCCCARRAAAWWRNWTLLLAGLAFGTLAFAFAIVAHVTGSFFERS